MPTPIGHGLMGLAVGTALNLKRPLLSPWRDVVLFLLIAMGPDLDFIPGLLIGNPEAFHHRASHSLGFSVLAGVLMGLVGRSRGQGLRWGVTFGLIYFTQVVMDAYGADYSEPFGVPLWWPLSNEFVSATPKIFLDIRRIPLNWANMVHNIRAAGLEIILAGIPCILALWLMKRIRAKNKSA